MDEAFELMGGFGTFQKFSYLVNTLAQGSAAFFMYCFVFLEKQPIYQCRLKDPESKKYTWQQCKREQFCQDKDKVIWRVNWEHEESIHNLIEQLNFYCEPDIMIGLIGSLFLVGIVIGCSTLTRLGDVYGRKPIYIVGLLMHMICMVSILTTTSVIFSYFLLFVFGLSVTSRYYVGYTYNIEMQPKSHAVLVSTTMFIFESFVYIFISLFFWFVSDQWKLLQIPNLVLASFGTVCLFFMPESPRFLVSQRRFDEARQVFRYIGLKNGLSAEKISELLDDFKFEGELDKDTEDDNGNAAIQLDSDSILGSFADINNEESGRKKVRSSITASMEGLDR